MSCVEQTRLPDGRMRLVVELDPGDATGRPDWWIRDFHICLREIEKLLAWPAELPTNRKPDPN